MWPTYGGNESIRFGHFDEYALILILTGKLIVTYMEAVFREPGFDRKQCRQPVACRSDGSASDE